MAPADLPQAHRWFAVECNNRAWDLAAKTSRTPAEARELLLAAYAAAFHCSKVGSPINQMRAEVTVAHAHAVLGRGIDALHHARLALEFCESNPVEDWDLAFAQAEMAFAAAIVGDTAMHRQHYALAEQCGQAIKDQEDRDVFLAEFARIPAPTQ